MFKETTANRKAFLEIEATLNDEHTIAINFRDEAFDDVEGVETTKPTATVVDEDVRDYSIVQGDVLKFIDYLEVDRTLYIRGIRPDGTGMTDLILSET